MLLFLLVLLPLTAIPAEQVSYTAAEASTIRNLLVQTALSNVGSRYTYAGTTKESGFDCSGLVYRSYLDAAGIRLPRMVSDMYQRGTAVAKDELLPGDLLFFNTLGYISHVGMYIGNNKFVHAENERTGVVITKVDRPYYVRTFVGARRHIEGGTIPEENETAEDSYRFFHGYFNSTFGPMVLLVMDSYGNTKGKYQTKSGTGELFGKIDLAKMAFVGKWRMTNDKGSASGDVYFYLTEDKRGLNGYWRYEGERKWIENWNAVKR